MFVSECIHIQICMRQIARIEGWREGETEIEWMTEKERDQSGDRESGELHR